MFRWIMLTLAVFVGSAFVAESTAEARPWGYRGGGVRVYSGYGRVNAGVGRGYYPRYYNNYPYRYYNNYYRGYSPRYYYNY